MESDHRDVHFAPEHLYWKSTIRNPWPHDHVTWVVVTRELFDERDSKQKLHESVERYGHTTDRTCSTEDTREKMKYESLQLYVLRNVGIHIRKLSYGA